MSDPVTPLSKDAALESIATLLEGDRSEAGERVRAIVDQVRAAECAELGRTLMLLVSLGLERFPRTEIGISETAVSVRGHLTRFCPFCGAELPNHRPLAPVEGRG